MQPTCGITITTHNRKADLERTFQSIARLEPAPDEVLICADGCTDGTAEFVQKNFPHYRLFIVHDSRGSIPNRDSMMRAATSDLLLSLDDDSYPLEADAIGRIRTIFEKNRRLAVATFPQRSDEFPETLNQRDFGPAHFVGTFTNSGSVIRRETFLKLEGYPVDFRHAYEEPDFALRCVAAGWEVRFETDVTVRHHYTGVQRNEMRTHHFHSRNEQWSLWMRCPLLFAPAVSMFRLLRQFGYACHRGWSWVVREPIWWGRCLAGLPRCLAARKAIPWRLYKNWLLLVRHPIFSESEWREKFSR